MSTRSTVAYEDDNGKTIGVYCHYDGFPSRMLPILKNMTFEDVKAMVEDALCNGGLRYIEHDSTYETYMEHCERSMWLHETPFAKLNESDYTYVKRKNNTIFATDSQNNILEDG